MDCDEEAPPPPPHITTNATSDTDDELDTDIQLPQQHQCNNTRTCNNSSSSLAELVPVGHEFHENRWNASPNPFIRKTVNNGLFSAADDNGDVEEDVRKGGSGVDEEAMNARSKLELSGVSTDEESQPAPIMTLSPIAASIDEDGNIQCIMGQLSDADVSVDRNAVEVSVIGSTMMLSLFFLFILRGGHTLVLNISVFECAYPSLETITSRFQEITISPEDDDAAEGKHICRRSITATSICDSIKYIYSLAALVLSVTFVMAALFTDQTNAAVLNIPPAAAFFIFWFSLAWLGKIEGGQGCLVGLRPVNKDRYADSHPVAYKCTTLAHKGNNMERFIVGRQFLVVLIVFVTNICGAVVAGAEVLGLPAAINDIFLSSGLALMLTTVILGQLTAQVNAAYCMLDFINSYFMLFSTYVSLGIELSGVLHSVYLVQILISRITGKTIESDEPPLNALQRSLFWSRVLLSLVILGTAFAVTLGALFEGKTTAWNGLPPYASVLIFFLLMCIAGMMEGMQIALFAVANLPKDELDSYAIATKICKLIFNEHKLQAFLIGRQIFVTVCTFIIAKITTLNIVPGEGDNIFGVSDGLQNFFNTGLLGAIITTIFASLVWRITASDFPIVFLNNPIAYAILRLCLLVEMSGICNAAWVTACVYRFVAKYKPDDVHVRGTGVGVKDGGV